MLHAMMSAPVQSKSKDRTVEICILGGRGFIGAQLALALLRCGHSVSVVDNLSVTPLTSQVCRFTCKDVRDLSAQDFDGVDVVINLAALKSVPKSFEGGTAAHNFALDSHSIHMAAAARVPKFVQGSTCEVYGPSGSIPNRETDPLQPASPYAVAKGASEALLRTYADSHGLASVCLRIFNTYGPTEGDDAVIPRFVRKAIAGEPIEVEGDGLQRRDFSYIDNTVQSIVRCIEYKGDPAERTWTTNICSGSSTSILDVVESLQKLHPVKHTVGRGRLNEIMEFRGDSSYLRSKIGPLESTPLDVGIEKTYTAIARANEVPHD